MKAVSHSEAWTGVANCRDCPIRRSVLFSGLEEADFEHLHQPIDQFHFEPGGQLYSQDQTADFIYTIRSGLVKTVQYLPDGTQRIVRLVGDTDVAGLEALLLDRYEHTAIALHPSEVCRIPRAVVKELASERPGLFHELMARWHRAVSDRDRMITELNTGTARARVVRLLLWLAERQGDDRCTLFGREDMAALLALTTETISRTMAELKRQGFISEPQPNRILCDIPNLERLLA